MRCREDREVESLAMANCMMLLSNMSKSNTKAPSSDRAFTCKTCNKGFPSFQALGGHRASHKRRRLINDHQIHSPAKPKKHECSICGLEFSLGQALGGHMRRHRNEITSSGHDNSEQTESGSQKSNYSHSENHRVLSLDLNLTPYENDLKFG